MKILYIHQYFKPPTEPGGTRSYWIAQEMIKQGHRVTIISGTSNPEVDKIHKIKIDGIDVIYIKEEYNQSMGIWNRFKAFAGFMIKSSREAFRQKDIDVLIATSTPLTIGIPALLLKWFKGIPYIFEVRDLWPEVPIQMGEITNPIIIRVLRSFEKLIYKRFEHVITLSPGMREGVLRYLPSRKVSMIPNMSKKDEFFPRDYEDELATAIGLKTDYLKIVHFGSLGEANGIDRVFDSIELLRDRKFQFLFLGAGAMEDRLKRRALDQQLENVIFHPRAALTK